MRTPPGGVVIDRVERDALADGLSRRWMWVLFWFPVAGSFALAALSLVSGPTYDRLLQDDQPLEWAQFCCLLMTAGFAALASGVLARGRDFAASCIAGLLCLGCIMLAGEEISWGQRVLGLGTPEELAEINIQAETNIHNIQSDLPIQWIFENAKLFIALAAIAVSLLVKCPPFLLRGRFWSLVSPPLYTLSLFVMPLLYVPMLFFGIRFFDALDLYQEWVEMCFYMGLAASALAIYVRGRGGPAASRGGGHAADPRWALRPVVWVALASVVITVLCAVLTLRSGMVPGNYLS